MFAIATVKPRARTERLGELGGSAASSSPPFLQRKAGRPDWPGGGKFAE